MTLLPGQRIVNGVPSLMFGSNVPPYSATQFMTTSQVQAQLKSMNIQVLRCAFTDNSGNNISDSAIDQMSAACTASGAVMLAIIPHQSQTYAQHMVTYLGSRCNLYELSNEPDINNISWQQYLSLWTSWIPGLRAINTNAAFIGPVLGVVANFQSYLQPWLAGCVNAGIMPDAISFHDYPCTSHPTQSVCATKAINIGNDAANLNQLVIATVGHAIPICVTEWNIDASSPIISYGTDPTFCNTWLISAIDAMIQNGVVMSCHFMWWYLVNQSSPYSPSYEYAPMAYETNKYLTGAAGSGGAGGGSGGGGSGSGGGGSSAGSSSSTQVTLAIPASSNFGVNYYHESMGYIGRTAAQITNDLTNIGLVSKNIKLYLNPYNNTSINQTHAQNVALLQQITQIAKTQGFYVVWVENLDNGQLTDAMWTSYINVVTSDAVAAQSVGADELLVGNEIIGSSHNNGDPGFSNANFPTRISALVDACRPYFKGKIGYQEVNTVTSMWTTNNGAVANLLHLDKIYFDLYDSLHNFESKAQYLYTVFGTQVALGEVSSYNTLGDISYGSAYSEADWSRELMRRYNVAQGIGIPFYIFTYGDPAPQSNGFGLRLSSSESQWHDIWQYLIHPATEQITYTQYFLDTFAAGSGTQDFAGDGVNGSGGMNVSGTNAGSFATAPGTDYVFRGALKPYSVSGSMRMVVRYTDANNYYGLDVNVGTSTVSLVRRQASVEAILGSLTFSSNGPIPPGYYPGALQTYNMYDFELRVSGTNSATHIAAYFETYKIAELTDTQNIGLNGTSFGNKNLGCNGTLYNLLASSLEVIGIPSSGGSSGPKIRTYGINTRLNLLTKNPRLGQTMRTNLAYMQDSFLRNSVKSGWGTNADGLTWSQYGIQATLTTNGTRGLMSSPGGGTMLILGSQSISAIGSVVRVMIHVTGDAIGVIVRFQDANNFYLLSYYDGLGLRIIKMVAGQLTVLTSSAYSMSHGVAYWLRVVTSGNALYLKAWQDGQAEPSVYQISMTDTSFSSGLCGLYGSPASTTSMQYDSFLVTYPYATTGTSAASGTSGIVSGAASSLASRTVFGLLLLGKGRSGDGGATSGTLIPKKGTFPLSYYVALSKHYTPIELDYIVQRGDTWPLLLYYLISPPSSFAINGHGVPKPDHMTYTPIAVAARTLIGGPILQGYRSMTWSYAVMTLSDYTTLLSYYSPNNSVVLLTYPDQSGTWVQRQAVMRPPQYGEQQNMLVFNVILTFSRL